MSLVEALDKGCMPLLGTVRFLFCGSRFLRVWFFGPCVPCHAPRLVAPASPRPLRVPLRVHLRLSFGRPFSALAPLRKINNISAVQSAMCGVQ